MTYAEAITPEVYEPKSAALSNQEAIQIAYDRLTSVVCFCLDQGLDPDEMDKQSIRKAYEMLGLVLNKRHVL